MLSFPGRRHLVITHKSLLRSMLCTALGLPPRQFRSIDIANASVCMVRSVRGAARLSMRAPVFLLLANTRSHPPTYFSCTRACTPNRCNARGDMMLSALNLTSHLEHEDVRYALPGTNQNDRLAAQCGYVAAAGPGAAGADGSGRNGSSTQS
jgi:hypothetical protein